MKKGSSSKKGGAFEREICKALSKWLTKGKRTDLLWRTASSGGRATIMNRAGQQNLRQVGDIGAIDPEGLRLTDRFVVECKHVRNLDVYSAITKKKGKLVKFWTKLLHECATTNRKPLLIARQNGFPIVAITNSDGATTLVPKAALQPRASIGPAGGPLFIYLFDDLLDQSCPL